MHKYAAKIDKLREARGWSIYKLSQESGLAPQTIYKWNETETTPLLSAIEQVCEAFGITLAQFFAEGDFVELTPELKNLFESWSLLSKKDKSSVETIIKSLIEKK